MKVWIFLPGILCMALTASGQNFELIDRQENYVSGFNQLVKIQLKVKNNTDRAQFYTIRKSKGDLGESQKGYFCLDSKCLESSITEFSKKIEPGETVNLNFTVESGMQSASNNFKFEIFPKGSPSEMIEHLVSLSVDERLKSIYQSKEAGQKLNAMLELGLSQPWQDALLQITGSRQMDATAIRDYFAPLQKWLDEQNKGLKAGW